MGLFKRENPYYKKTKARLDKDENVCGYLMFDSNEDAENDFDEGCHLCYEKGKMVIFGSNQKDYVFDNEQVVKWSKSDEAFVLPKKWEDLPATEYTVHLSDGKKFTCLVWDNQKAVFESIISE